MRAVITVWLVVRELLVLSFCLLRLPVPHLREPLLRLAKLAMITTATRKYVLSSEASQRGALSGGKSCLVTKNCCGSRSGPRQIAFWLDNEVRDDYGLRSTGILGRHRLVGESARFGAAALHWRF